MTCLRKLLKLFVTNIASSPRSIPEKMGGDEDKAFDELSKEKCESCVLNKLI